MDKSLLTFPGMPLPPTLFSSSLNAMPLFASHCSSMPPFHPAHLTFDSTELILRSKMELYQRDLLKINNIVEFVDYCNTILLFFKFFNNSFFV